MTDTKPGYTKQPRQPGPGIQPAVIQIPDYSLLLVIDSSGVGATVAGGVVLLRILPRQQVPDLCLGDSSLLPAAQIQRAPGGHQQSQLVAVDDAPQLTENVVRLLQGLHRSRGDIPRGSLWEAIRKIRQSTFSPIRP